MPLEDRNPWLALPLQAPFLLPQDEPKVLTFNKTAPSECIIRSELLPEPFLGRPTAPVVLLGLNPGYDPLDEVHHRDPTFASLSRRNLTHELQDHSFYLLHPSLRAPGTCWWEQRLGYLLRRLPRQLVAESVLCVEYFPYHSERFGMRRSLPSQTYGFDLVRAAVARGATVIVLRSVGKWEAAVPELVGYRRKYALRSPQNPTLTERNCPDGFAAVMETLELQ